MADRTSSDGMVGLRGAGRHQRQFAGCGASGSAGNRRVAHEIPPSAANALNALSRTSQARTRKPARNSDRATPIPIAPRPMTPTLRNMSGSDRVEKNESRARRCPCIDEAAMDCVSVKSELDLNAFLLRFARALIGGDFDLEQILRAAQRRARHAARGIDAPKALTDELHHFWHVRLTRNEHARAHHVLERRTDRCKRAFHVPERLLGLPNCCFRHL